MPHYGQNFMVIFCCCLRKCVWSNLVCLVLLSCGLHCRPRSECLHYLHYTCKTVQMKWAKDSKVFPKNMKHICKKSLFSLTFIWSNLSIVTVYASCVSSGDPCTLSPISRDAVQSKKSSVQWQSLPHLPKLKLKV